LSVKRRKKKREKELEDWREIGKLKRNYAKTGLQD
jgi:hypothetical protein